MAIVRKPLSRIRPKYEPVYQSPMALPDLEPYLKTEKQQEFDYDFRKDNEDYEVWEEVEVGETYDSAQTFDVKEEDMISLAKATMDDHPIMTDPDTDGGPFGGFVEHPMFLTEVAFWCIGKGPYGTWIRTAGAMNPGQKIERYERFKVGEEIRMTQTPVDKWEKNGRPYLTSRFDYFNEDDVLKARWWGTLILPRTREDLRRFQYAINDEEGDE